jgi:hypothetical protein
MTTAANPPKVPAAGPRDPRLYLTALALLDADAGSIDPDTGRLWVGNRRRKVRYEVDPAVLDRLIELGWVDDTRAHDELHLTEAGRYWLARFLKANGGTA